MPSAADTCSTPGESGWSAATGAAAAGAGSALSDGHSWTPFTSPPRIACVFRCKCVTQRRVVTSVASVALAALTCCAPRHVPPAAERARPPPADVAVAVAAPEPPASPAERAIAEAPLPATRTVYGFLGERGIVGTLGAENDRWAGSFRFLDGAEMVRINGSASPSEAEASPEEARLDGRRHHTFLDCEFDTAGALEGVVSGATCLDEEGVLEIDGWWSAGNRTEPFYLRTPASNTIDASEHYTALIATPAPAHGCPPVVDLLQRAEHATGRTTLLYRMTWPCDSTFAESPLPFVAPDRKHAPAPASHEAYLADVASGTPGQLVWSASVSALPDPDELNEVELGFTAQDLAPGLVLYIASVSDSFQSPISSGGNSTSTAAIWTVSAEGQHGPKLSVSTSEAGHAGWCFASSTSSEAWLIDLDANRIPELVVRTTTTGRHDAIVNGQVTCVDAPVERAWSAYRLQPQTLAWKALKSVPRLSDARLASARQLAL